jgi:DNA modification methylase
VTVLRGDCLAVMPTLDADSVGAIVCDPPYGLSFMGKNWDHGIPGVAFWAEALRVAKPGAHLVAFGGSRTFHRLACAIEDAGWEIRDTLSWLYGSGFPKSKNIGGGWGTALKPAWEPIILARKPLSGTVAQTVTQWGTGAINVDACRIAATDKAKFPAGIVSDTEAVFGGGEGRYANRPRGEDTNPAGRWPANVVLSHAPECRQVGTRKVKGAANPDRFKGTKKFNGKTYAGDSCSLNMESGEARVYADADGTETVPAWECAPGCPVAMLDAQSGERKSPGTYQRSTVVENRVYGASSERPVQIGHGDQGGASRFFLTVRANDEHDSNGGHGSSHGLRVDEEGLGVRFGYFPKASRREREAGLDGLKATHPTVKPLALMRWLCRLVTPPGGLILDPFTGSGTTGCAAVLEGFRFLGIEQEAEYVAIAERRIAHWAATVARHDPQTELEVA